MERAGIKRAREEAIYLLGLLLDLRRGQLLVDPARSVDASRVSTFTDWVRRRAAREPAQRIAARQEFYGLEFVLTRDVLIPRPETEMLVDLALAATPRDGTVIDLGTGSGCIVVALAVERADLHGRALDNSAPALEVARSNAERHQVAARIEFVNRCFSNPPPAWAGSADTVLSNPPYVSSAAWRELEPEVREHDPLGALVPLGAAAGAATGLEAYAALLPAAFDLLRPGGRLAVEVGAGQAGAVAALFASTGFEALERRVDLNAIERVVTGTRRQC